MNAGVLLGAANDLREARIGLELAWPNCYTRDYVAAVMASLCTYTSTARHIWKQYTNENQFADRKKRGETERRRSEDATRVDPPDASRRFF